MSHRERGRPRFADHVARLGEVRPSSLTPDYPPLESLRALKDHLISLAYEPSTNAGYSRALRQWQSFAAHYAFPPIPTADTLCEFITYRHMRAPKSIHATLSGLASHFKLIIGQDAWHAVRNAPSVLLTLRGSIKKTASTPKRAPPMWYTHVIKAAHFAIHPDASFDDLMWGAMVIVLFLCCGRASETTQADRPAFRDSRKLQRRESTRIDALGFSSLLPYHKDSPLYAGSHYIFVAADSGPLLFDVVRRYIFARDTAFGPTGPLWLRLRAGVPTRRWYVDRVKRIIDPNLTGHSGRSGGAIWYILNGVDDTAIKRHGRWSSSAWEDYIRLQPEIAIALRVRDAARRDPAIRTLPPRAVLARLAELGM